MNFCRRHLLIVLASSFFLSIIGWQAAEGAIVAKARNTASPSAAPKVGEIVVNVSLPFEKLSQLLNQFEFTIRSKGVAGGVVSYNGTLKIGQISLLASGQDQFPVRVVAPFKLNGELAGYPIEQIGEATVDFAIDLGSDWCPGLKFDEPQVSFKDKERLPPKVVKSIPSLSDFVASRFLSSELKQNLTCAVFKKEIAKVWAPVSVPLQTTGKKLFLTIDPQSVAVSGVTVGQDRIALSISLGGHASISSRTTVLQKKSLPNIKLISRQNMRDPTTEVEASVTLPINLNFP